MITLKVAFNYRYFQLLITITAGLGGTGLGEIVNKHFYVRRIELYLYLYIVYGTISIQILKGKVSVYQLILKYIICIYFSQAIYDFG